jgi:hypothetical protein
VRVNHANLFTVARSPFVQHGVRPRGGREGRAAGACAAKAWYAEDRGANPIFDGGPPRGPLLDELETYVESYKPRERPDVVYVNVR